MTTNTSIHLIQRPTGGAISDALFDTREATLPPLNDGEVLIKQTHMSLDPAMIGWMSPDPDSYIPPVALGEVMRSAGIGEVLDSTHSDFKPGDRVQGMMGWQTHYQGTPAGLNKIDAPLPAETILSIFALPGLTATQGLFNIGQPKQGETIVITGAAGSVGSIVGQLAKAEGLHVIGIVGSEEKANWIVNELGFDGAINYKDSNLSEQLEALTPDGIDLFFENTGGAIQQSIFDRMNAHGRIIVCGLIADYLAAEPSAGPNWIPIIKKRLNIQGFAMPDHLHQAPQLIEKLTPYVMQGKIKHRSHTLSGLESAIDGLNLFFTGENKGKLLVEL